MYFTDGVPLVASLPHFYEGDPVLLEGIEGLNPVKEEHETAIDVEPVSQIFFSNSIYMNNFRIMNSVEKGMFGFL